MGWKKVNIYTDSRFATAYAHGQINREEKTIKSKHEIVQLHLSARSVYWSQYISKDIKKTKAPQIQGNNYADQVTKKAALGEPKAQGTLELSAVP